jgi:histidinol dehydrogenase
MMLKTYSKEEAKKSILNRGFKDNLPEETVRKIVNDVKERGDIALKEWTNKFDKVKIDQFEIKDINYQEYLDVVDQELKQSIELARDRIYKYHQSQPNSSWVNNKLGGELGQIIRPIATVGIYIPGGTSPLFSSILMTAIPAIVAGTKNIIFASPPNQDGTLSNIILATFGLIKKMGANIRIFKIGGAQAIAAMAFGTEQVPKVDKIVGPGNIYVNLAKKEVYGYVGIDGIYGPTEALIIADESATPSLVAADLLAQAEHDTLAIPILITHASSIISAVKKELERQIEILERKNIVKESLYNKGGIILTKSIEESIKISNEFGPEHLSLMLKEPSEYIDQIENAGGIFIGENSFEVLGDYIAGPSHVMPTNGTAHFSSPLSVYDFVKRISLIKLNRDTAIQLSKSAEIMANNEDLSGHATSANLRGEESE